MRLLSKQKRINMPFQREGTKHYAAALSLVVANIAFNSAWAKKIINPVEFDSTMTILTPQDPTTITSQTINQSPIFIINVLSKALIQEIEAEFKDNNNVDFKVIHSDEADVDQLSGQDEATQDEFYINDENIKAEINNLLIYDDEVDLLINQINTYDEKAKAIAIANEINKQESPTINSEDESSSTGLILTIIGLLGAGGAGIAFAGGGSDSTPSPTPPSPPPDFTLDDAHIFEGNLMQLTFAETDQYGELTYTATYDSANVDIHINNNIAIIEGLDDSEAEVNITATNIHELSTTESFKLAVDNVAPKTDDIDNYEMHATSTLIVNFSAKDVKQDDVIFTASTVDNDLINLSLTNFDDHTAELKIIPVDIFPHGMHTVNIKVVATDDDGGVGEGGRIRSAACKCNASSAGT